ncbi:MAG: sensor histidine kinase [Acidimicrobiales bacterium]|nr:sensor histidine kinase [Acidimicrobiales bacterium]
MRSALRSALQEPRVPDVPIRVWRDWALVATFIAASLLEIALREAVGWRPGALLATFIFAAAMFWRRTHPFLATATLFGSITFLDVISRIVADRPIEIYTSAVILIVPYALFRWGSGRQAALGIVIMLAMLVTSLTLNWTGVGDAIGGTLVFFFPAALGTIVRYQGTSHTRSLEAVKLREREQLARELHDTVAHHVSAIAIQAQAGRAVAATDPAAALNFLATIETEASRTLAEMRTMVGALRSGDEPELAPQPGVADIKRLSDHSPHLPVTVRSSGDFTDLSPSVDRALFRLAQESITNATRHARNATGVTVWVDAEQDRVRLSVMDDGEPRSFDVKYDVGFGLVGMTERASLLGGTLDAGPNPNGGWTVRAVLPKTGRAT